MKYDLILGRYSTEDNGFRDLMVAPYYSCIEIGDLVVSTESACYEVEEIIQVNDDYSTGKDIKKLAEWSTKTAIDKLPKIKKHYSLNDVKYEDEMIEVKEVENE